MHIIITTWVLFAHRCLPLLITSFLFITSLHSSQHIIVIVHTASFLSKTFQDGSKKWKTILEVDNKQFTITVNTRQTIIVERWTVRGMVNKLLFCWKVETKKCQCFNFLSTVDVTEVDLDSSNVYAPERVAVINRLKEAISLYILQCPDLIQD